MSRDPLYWGLILIMGSFTGLLAYNNDRQYQRIGITHFILYVLLSLIGTAIGAFYLGPALQMIVHTLLGLPPAQREWPAPISLKGEYLVIGAAAGALIGNAIARILCRRFEAR